MARTLRTKDRRCDSWNAKLSQRKKLLELYLQQQQRLSQDDCQDDRPHDHAAPPISDAVAASDAFASLPGDHSECDDDMIVNTVKFLDDNSSSVDDMCNNELLDDFELSTDKSKQLRSNKES
jgi:hypothetical protein